MRNFKIPITILVLFFLIIISCVKEQQKPAVQTIKIPTPEIEKQKYRNKSINLVKSLKKNASLSEMRTRVPEIIAEIKKGRQTDKPMIYEAISLLADHPQAAESIQDYYESLSNEAFRDRLFVLSIIGQMRSNENFEFLNKIIWSPLPAAMPRGDQADGLSERRQEETVRIKAIHGIGYLRTEQAYSALKKIMLEHESSIMRTVAIDTYLWNHNDDPKVMKELKAVLPNEYQKYVGVPRFNNQTSHIEFQRRVKMRRDQISYSK